MCAGWGHGNSSYRFVPDEVLYLSNSFQFIRFKKHVVLFLSAVKYNIHFLKNRQKWLKW